MTTRHAPHPLERVLAGMLQIGTILACVVVAIGIGLEAAGMAERFSIHVAGRQLDVISLGIIAFILLPVLRVVVMLGWYLRGRDLRMAAVVGVVLVIIGLGLVAGVRFPG